LLSIIKVSILDIKAIDMSLFHHLFLPHHTNNQRAKILHPSFLSLIIGLFAVFQIAIGRFSVQFPYILGFASQIPPAEIIRLTNQERTSHGLSELKLDPQLSAAAAQKAADMFAKNYWAHVSPTGTQPWFFITESGYAYRYAGENLARDFSDPGSVVTAWMNSPSHRENLLNSRYQDIGVAVIDGQLEGRDTTLVVQMFGIKLTGQPQVAQSATSVVAQAKTLPEPTMAPTPTVTPPADNLPQSSTSLASTREPANTSISPFELTKYASMGLLILFSLVLIADVFIINRHKIVRWTSKSLAHLIFIIILLVAVSTVLRGRIL
jgi:hypothetical protein